MDFNFKPEDRIFSLPSGNSARFGEATQGADASTWAVAFAIDGRFLNDADMAHLLNKVLPKVLPQLIGEKNQPSAGFYL